MIVNCPTHAAGTATHCTLTRARTNLLLGLQPAPPPLSTLARAGHTTKGNLEKPLRTPLVADVFLAGYERARARDIIWTNFDLIVSTDFYVRVSPATGVCTATPRHRPRAPVAQTHAHACARGPCLRLCKVRAAQAQCQRHVCFSIHA